MATAALDAPLTNGAAQTWHEKYNFDTGPIPIEPYISEDYFKLEQERVFRKVWLNVGRIEQIPNPGDYFVKDLPMCRTSLIVTRDKKGQVRAFHNMCAHRGNKVCGTAAAPVRTSPVNSTAGVMDSTVTQIRAG